MRNAFMRLHLATATASAATIQLEQAAADTSAPLKDKEERALITQAFVARLRNGLARSAKRI